MIKIRVCKYYSVPEGNYCNGCSQIYVVPNRGHTCKVFNRKIDVQNQTGFKCQECREATLKIEEVENV